MPKISHGACGFCFVFMLLHRKSLPLAFRRWHKQSNNNRKSIVLTWFALFALYSMYFFVNVDMWCAYFDMDNINRKVQVVIFMFRYFCQSLRVDFGVVFLVAFSAVTHLREVTLGMFRVKSYEKCFRGKFVVSIANT